MFSNFLQKIKDLQLPAGEFAIFGSGPLAVRNIRESHDADLIVFEKLFEEYKQKSDWKYKGFERDGRYVEMIEKDEVEFYKDWRPGEWNIAKLIQESEIINGLPFVKLDEVLKWKKISNREKDKKDILLIEKYLQNNQ